MFPCSKTFAVTYVDHVLAQFAGEIGLVSMGLGKTFSRYTFAGMYGLTPHEISGIGMIETIAARQTYRFYDKKKITLYVGLNIYHTLGLAYQTEKFRDSPKGYYSVGSVRGILNLGISLAIDNKNKRFFYFEGGLNDIWLTNWLTNQETIHPIDHLSLAMGLKEQF